MPGRSTAISDPRTRRISPKSSDEIRDVGLVIQSQMSLLKGIKDEELDQESVLDEIYAKIDELETYKHTMTKRIVLDINFLTKCYNAVVFALEEAKALMMRNGRMLMSQGLVEDDVADPYVNMNMQYDFITCFQVCLQQHTKVLKQTRMTVTVSAVDSMMQISELVHKIVGPAASFAEKDYTTKALKYRNKKLYGEPQAADEDFFAQT